MYCIHIYIMYSNYSISTVYILTHTKVDLYATSE